MQQSIHYYSWKTNQELKCVDKMIFEIYKWFTNIRFVYCEYISSETHLSIAMVAYNWYAILLSPLFIRSY